ncbi:hypothetical protein N9773_00010 [Flavobacteriaceae bacterium]|nr:hypothetical protein [Flavobacteriaceae bacterium]
MKIITPSLILLFITLFELNAQETGISNGLFITFNQFKSKKSCPIKSIDLNSSDLLLSVKNIVSDCAGYKKTNKLIAIQYENDIYYNMKFNVEFLTKNKFSKLLVNGKYCAFLVDESYPINIQGQAGFNTGGLLGAIILGANGKNKIYYFDIEKGHKTKVLTKKRLKELLSIDKELFDSFNKEENISADLFLNYLEKLNKEYEK